MINGNEVIVLESCTEKIVEILHIIFEKYIKNEFDKNFIKHGDYIYFAKLYNIEKDLIEAVMEQNKKIDFEHLRPIWKILYDYFNFSTINRILHSIYNMKFNYLT